MYAIIETGGKQYRVENGDVIFVEKLNVAEEATVKFDKVIAVSKKEGALTVGKPYVKNAVVTGKVLKNGKGKKITVFTYKPKKSSSRKMGHRQPYTKIQIEDISTATANTTEKAAVKTTEKAAAKTTTKAAAKTTAKTATKTTAKAATKTTTKTAAKSTTKTAAKTTTKAATKTTAKTATKAAK